MLDHNSCLATQFNAPMMYHNMRKVDHPVYFRDIIEVARLGSSKSYRLKSKEGVYYFLMIGGQDVN